jgi:hypothetical protein
MPLAASHLPLKMRAELKRQQTFSGFLSSSSSFLSYGCVEASNLRFRGEPGAEWGSVFRGSVGSGLLAQFLRLAKAEGKAVEQIAPLGGFFRFLITIEATPLMDVGSA